MRRLVMVLVIGAVLFGVVGAAAAEGNSIVPWSKTRHDQKPIVVPFEGGSIVPWADEKPW